MELKGKLFVFAKKWKSGKNEVTLVSTNIRTKDKDGKDTGRVFLPVRFVKDLKGKESLFEENQCYEIEIEEGFLSAYKDGNGRDIFSVVISRGKVLSKKEVKKEPPSSVDIPDDDLPF